MENLAPIGFFPSFVTKLPHSQSDLDSYGCMISYNNAVVDYNNLLREKLEEFWKVLTDALVIYFDSHAIKLYIFTNPTKHGKLLFQWWSSSGMCTYSLIVKNIQKMLHCMYSLHTWGIDHLKEVYHVIPFLNTLIFLRDKIIFKDINIVYNTE